MSRLAAVAFQKIIYPSVLLLLGERSLYSHLESLRAQQWWTADQLRAYQSEQLRSLLRFAATHSEFYRSRIGSKLDRLQIDSVESPRQVLKDLPILTKNHLQKDADSMTSESPGWRTARKTTGGSTGQPVTVLKNRDGTARERAAMWLGYSWNGVSIGDKAARFWGVGHTRRRRLLSVLGDFAMRRRRFSAFAFEDLHLDEYWRECLRFEPDYLHGYVSMLEALARHLQAGGRDASDLGLKSVIATSEVLSDPQRELLREVFKAPVQVEYGCGELGPIAYECERGTLHTLPTNVIVEILGSDGESVPAGESGEIVVTDLHNRVMPLIRYRLGDFGVPGGDCACGRRFPVLQRIWGRAYEFVVSPEGRRYHGEFFMYIFEDLRERGLQIDQFQVVQKGQASLEILVKHGEPSPTDLKGPIREVFRRRLPQMAVTIRKVEEIPRTASGKMQVIRNDIVDR